MTPVDGYLADLPNLVIELEMELVDGTPKGNGRSGKPASRPPVNLGTVSDIHDAWLWLGEQTGAWCDFMDLRGPHPYTWASACLWHRNHWPNLDGHPAAPDFANELRDHHRRLTYHLPNERLWIPLPGDPHCPIDYPDTGRCGGELREHQERRQVRCRDCHEVWERPDYPRLAALIGYEPQPVPVTDAAKYAEIPIRTLRDWIARGWVATVPGEGQKRVMYADVATLQQRLREGI